MLPPPSVDAYCPVVHRPLSQGNCPPCPLQPTHIVYTRRDNLGKFSFVTWTYRFDAFLKLVREEVIGALDTQTVFSRWILPSLVQTQLAPG